LGKTSALATAMKIKQRFDVFGVTPENGMNPGDAIL
jgi:hypothetical protein